MVKRLAIKKYGNGFDMEADENYIAAIDLGTNTFNLVISHAEKPFRLKYKTEKGVFLGKGGLAEQRITQEAVERAQSVLDAYSKTLKEYPISRIVCVATEALRNAKNAKDVIDHLSVDIPFEVDTIEGEKEAELVYYGVLSSGILNEETSMIMDIGGGSVEFIIANKNEVFWRKSYKAGISRTLELHPLSDPPLQKEIQTHTKYFSDKLSELSSYIDKYQVKHLIGTAGSFDSWRKILDPSQSIDPTYEIEENELLKIIIDIQNADLDQRAKIKGMEKMRIETIVPAGILVTYLLESYTFNKITQCSYSLSEGVLWQLLNN